MENLEIFELLLRDVKAFEEIYEMEEKTSPNSWEEGFLEDFVKYDALFREASKVLGIKYHARPTGNAQDVMKSIGINFTEFCKKLNSLRIEAIYVRQELAAKNVYSTATGEISQLDQTQKLQIQDSIGSIRAGLEEANWLSDEHRQRLRDKINEFQTELDRPLGSFYRRLGMLEDLGESLGTFGKKAKPLTDRIKDVSDSLKIFSRKNAQIEKDADPLQIPDMSDEESEGE